MVDKTLNDGTGFTGACRGTGATTGAVGAAVGLEAKKRGSTCGKHTCTASV